MLVDLRNHGASAALETFPPPHDIRSTAQDLIDLCEHTNKHRRPFSLLKEGNACYLENGQCLYRGILWAEKWPWSTFVCCRTTPGPKKNSPSRYRTPAAETTLAIAAPGLDSRFSARTSLT